jgi:hypothetical protein
MIIRHCAALAILPLLALSGAASAQPAVRVRHLPPAETPPARTLALEATVDRAWEATIELSYRAAGDSAWTHATFARRTPTQYVAEIPAAVVQPPGVEYFIATAAATTGADAAGNVLFASPEAPHRVAVFPKATALLRDRYLERYQGRLAQIRVAGEYVDYGSRRYGEVELPDRYYRVDADVTYRLLRMPLVSLRFGYTHLIGETAPPGARDQAGSCMDAGQEPCQAFDAGLKGGGWFELRFGLSEGVELDARGMVMATQEGFVMGGRGELRFGHLETSHVAAGVEAIADVGTAGFVRLGWGTVPGLSMAATVEVTDFPAAHRPAAVRLLYDLARPIGSGTRVGLRAGYQARDQGIGGATLGLNTSLEF